MNNKEMLKAIALLCEEKGLSEEYILDALEQGLVKAYKRSFPSAAAARRFMVSRIRMP